VIADHGSLANQFEIAVRVLTPLIFDPQERVLKGVVPQESDAFARRFLVAAGAGFSLFEDDALGISVTGPGQGMRRTRWPLGKRRRKTLSLHRRVERIRRPRSRTLVLVPFRFR
jgi:hypothetical protein